MDSTIVGSLISFIGILFGLMISEIIRRINRVEKFSEAYFSKKIDVFDKLIEEFCDLTNLFSELLSNDVSLKEKLEIWQDKVLSFLEFTDKKWIFIGEELTVHIGMVLVGAGEALEKPDNNSEIEISKEFKEVKNLIRKALGLNKIEISYTKSLKSKIGSDYISYYKKIKKKYEKNMGNN